MTTKYSVLCMQTPAFLPDVTKNMEWTNATPQAAPLVYNRVWVKPGRWTTYARKNQLISVGSGFRLCVIESSTSLSVNLSA